MKQPQSSAGAVQPAIVVAGDVASILLFAALGRNTHHQTGGGPVLGTVGVAAPFLVGWFSTALSLHLYNRGGSLSTARSLFAVSRSWLLGCILGLIIRSVQRDRPAPLSFAVVTFGFVLALLLVWRLLLLEVFPRLSSDPTTR